METTPPFGHPSKGEEFVEECSSVFSSKGGEFVLFIYCVCGNSPPLEGCQAKPDGVVLKLDEEVPTRSDSPLKSRYSPPREGNLYSSFIVSAEIPLLWRGVRRSLTG
ncbi:MAG: hypothetical protein K8G78_00615, partial [Deltaproteobacteria bacterium]|nr:hypothetical protein [Candidatus Kapabacteria bacterium]